MAELLLSDLLLRDYAYNTYVYRAKSGEGETLAVVTAPEFWAHCAKKLRIGDKIEILADDGSWEWAGRVRRKGAVEVFFREIFFWEASGDEDMPSAPLPYTVGWGGPHHKHRVINSAGEILESGFATKEEAEQFLADYNAGKLKQAA